MPLLCLPCHIEQVVRTRPSQLGVDTYFVIYTPVQVHASSREYAVNAGCVARNCTQVCLVARKRTQIFLCPPDWLQTVDKPISIFHPRKVMLDIVLFLAGQGINQHVYHRVSHWCSTCQLVYVSHYTDLFSFRFAHNFFQGTKVSFAIWKYA